MRTFASNGLTDESHSNARNEEPENNKNKSCSACWRPLLLSNLLALANMSSQPESFSGDWITASHPGYSEAIARWAANAQRRATAVAFVKSAQDVAIVLSHAKQHKLLIAIRGGGHSPSGASSIEGGIVVDLSRYLSDVRVDPVEKLAYVGGGAIWATVDKTAIEHGLATVAGTVNHVSPFR
jgi:FAD binding domain